MAGLDPLSIGMAAVGTGAKLASIPGSFINQRKSQRALDALRNQKMARYSVDPRIAKIYEQASSEASAPRGFGGSAEAGFRNQLTKGMRGRFMNALTVGGGSSARGVNAVLAGQEGDALTNYATANENMVRGNRNAAFGRMGTAANQYQRTGDQNTANDINYRMQLERALGESIRSEKDYRRNMLGSAGSDLLTAGIYNGFGSKTTPAIPTDTLGSLPPGVNVWSKGQDPSAWSRMGGYKFGDMANQDAALNAKNYRARMVRLGAYDNKFPAPYALSYYGDSSIDQAPSRRILTPRFNPSFNPTNLPF